MKVVIKPTSHREEPFRGRATWRSQPFMSARPELFISAHPETFPSTHPEPVEGGEIFPCHSDPSFRKGKNLGGGEDDEIATSFNGRTRNDTQ
ncbi:MAG: hypothetical protein A2Z75_02185 [Chloroflexi bacterium RBG_13_50_10]|nr:MAG: hypothetical protein A2Z75_02185 [Chloroflexi bacterium RBG_13_50_10]